MEYIAASMGEKTFYIEQPRILAIIDAPRIHEVPGAGSHIAGISVYEDKLVVYYTMGCACSPACGIVVDTEGTVLSGIAAERVGVQEMDSDVLLPVMPGIWVVCDDKIN